MIANIETEFPNVALEDHEDVAPFDAKSGGEFLAN